MAATAARNSALRGVQQEREAADGKQEQQAKAAGDAAAGMQQQTGGHQVDRRLEDGLHDRRLPAAAAPR